MSFDRSNADTVRQSAAECHCGEPWSSRPSGVAIALGSVIMVVFMAMHPTAHSHDPAGFIAEVSRTAVFNGVVHGTLIGAICLTAVGLIGFAFRLGMRLILVRAGLVAYLVGMIALTAAAAINGFIVPAVASRYQDASAASLDATTPILVLCHEANGVCGRLGVIAWSAAVLAWSLVLAWRPPVSRASGVLGLICAGLPLLALAAGRLPMNVHGFGAFVLLQAIWYLAIAVQLIRNRIRCRCEPPERCSEKGVFEARIRKQVRPL